MGAEGLRTWASAGAERKGWQMQTELWYTDEHTRDVRFSMKTTEQIASKKSAVQQIDILDTTAYGRVLVLDGGLMITEKDEFIS